MTYYTYDPDTSELTGIGEADYDPIEYGVMLPTYATSLMPPTEFLTDGEEAKGKVAVYNSEKKEWEILTDYRGDWTDIDTCQSESIDCIYDMSKGETFNEREEQKKLRLPYNFDEKTQILTLRSGRRLSRATINEEWGVTSDFVSYNENTKSFTPDVDKILGMKESSNGLLQELKRAYETKCEALLTYKGKDFQVDDTSLNQMRNYITLMEGTGKSVNWVCADNSTLNVNCNDLKNIVSNLTDRNKGYFTQYQEIKGKLKACATITEIEALCPNYRVLLNKSEATTNEKFQF